MADNIGWVGTDGWLYRAVAPASAAVVEGISAQMMADWEHLAVARVNHLLRRVPSRDLTLARTLFASSELAHRICQGDAGESIASGEGMSGAFDAPDIRVRSWR